MTVRWEYMTICWVARRNPGRHVFLVRTPGEEEEETRLQWSKADPDAVGPKAEDLLNEFGAEGWELVTALVTESAVGATLSGWDRGGFPIQREWIFKRPAEPR